MSLINVSNIFCDTKCLQNKEMKELFDNYEFVKQQLQDEVNSSKNYYNISSSNSNSNTGALIMNSEKNKKMVNTFDISIGNIQNKIDVYKNNIDNSNKDVELYNLYYEKNNDLLRKSNDNTTNTLTNERNSYYENESTTSNTFYNNILKYMYFIILLLFIVFLYLSKINTLTTSVIIFLFLLFLIFPFVFYGIFKSLHYVFLK
jgi:hypothetical protein